MKGDSEARVRSALNEIARDDTFPLTFLKLPDDARNWKPADFAVWWWIGMGCVGSAFVEVKQTDAVLRFSLAEIRQSQWLGLRHAVRVGMHYWLVVWWTKRKRWTISPLERLVAVLPDYLADHARSVPYDQLVEIGIDADNRQLTMMLRAAFMGELSDAGQRAPDVEPEGEVR